MKYYSLILACFISLGVFAQPSNFCATEHDEESEKFLDQFFNGELDLKTSNDIIWAPMTIHLVSPTDGPQPSFRELEAAIAFCQLNEDFQSTGIQFYLASFNYISNNIYYEHTFQQGAQMMNFNNVHGTINSYFVLDPAGACGYFTGSGRAVAMAFSCSGPNDHTWAHEIGHYLALPHTFRGWEGEEYKAGDIAPNAVNGVFVERYMDTNCHNQADRFCDTPQDYLSVRWNCNNNLESNVLQTDPDSIEFRSDGSYFMSYANDNCMDKFSPLQEQAMILNLMSTKPEQIDQNYQIVELDLENITGTFPINDEIISDNSVLLQWDDEDQDVFGYFVEVSRFEGFNFFVQSGYTTDNSFMATDLLDDKDYFWRITPISRSSFCNEPIVNTFKTSFITSTEELSHNVSINISPNPNNGNFILSSEYNLSGNVNIYNLHSQLIFSQQVNQVNSFEMNLDVPPGIYILQTECKGNKINKKFVVQ